MIRKAIGVAIFLSVIARESWALKSMGGSWWEDFWEEDATQHLLYAIIGAVIASGLLLLCSRIARRKLFGSRETKDEMDRSSETVRLAAAVLAAVIAAGFVTLYSARELHNAQAQGMKTGFPALTCFYMVTAPFGGLVPIIVLCVGALGFRLEKGGKLLVEIASSIGWLFALAWSLGCIWAWKMPYYIGAIVGES